MRGMNQTILQNFPIIENKTSVSKVECCVCGKGLQDGHSISAKTSLDGIVLFCDVHYELE